MISYRTYNTYALLTTVLILVLSALACAAPGWTTASTTPVPTVVKVSTTPNKPDNTLTTVTATSLHVRAEPMGLRIGYLYHADRVTLTGTCRDGWAEIEWEGGVAWVSARYLSDNSCKE